MGSAHDDANPESPSRTPPLHLSYALLLPLILANLVLSGLQDRHPLLHGSSLWMAVGNLVLALYVSRVPRKFFLAVGFLALAAAAAWGPARAVHGVPEIVAVVSFGTLNVLAPAAILRRVRREFGEEGVDAEALLGVLCAYLFIGGWFAFVYRAVAILSKAPFFAQPGSEDGLNYLYFSFVTLATVGYGDLSPAGGPGRMLAATEGIVGQLYLVSVVALVVSSFRIRKGPRP